MPKYILSALLSLTLAAPVLAQSQGANGAIEGMVTDSSGGVLPGVTVTITNLDTGAGRSIVTNEKGLYRAPLLPLGTYRVVAELQGFKRFEQTGITLSVGQSAVVNVLMGVGVVSETITVIANSPLLDTARIDIGHTMSDLEVHNLPLVARNPYNFALVQPGVTGIENVEFGVPRLAANGAAMRINYMIDGNTNTEKDRAGLRLLPMSEVMIQEVKVVTTGFAPEFGQTMGMVYNAVTPSGTNKFKGEAGYLFRRNSFSAFPFFFGCGSTTAAANCPARAADAARGAVEGREDAVAGRAMESPAERLELRVLGLQLRPERRTGLGELSRRARRCGLELRVHYLRAADKTHRSRAKAVPVEAILRRLDEPAPRTSVRCVFVIREWARATMLTTSRFARRTLRASRAKVNASTQLSTRGRCPRLCRQTNRLRLAQSHRLIITGLWDWSLRPPRTQSMSTT